MLCVDPDVQAAGLGRALLAQCDAVAQADLGATAIEMTVIDRRPELIAWYERRGYAALVKPGRSPARLRSILPWSCWNARFPERFASQRFSAPQARFGQAWIVTYGDRPDEAPVPCCQPVRPFAGCADLSCRRPGGADCPVVSPGATVLTVQAEGRSTRVPDLAVFSAGVTSEGKTASEALAANARAMNATMAALKASGVAARDMHPATCRSALSMASRSACPMAAPRAIR
jgi:hypothetical protein